MNFYGNYATITICRVLAADFTEVFGMYQAGDWVVYGVHGVCRVIGTEKQLVNRKRTLYLVLEPLTQAESRFYLPTDNSTALAKLKAVLSRDELSTLIDSDEVRKDCWIQEENRRKQFYRELISGGDRIALMQMIATLYRYKAEQQAAGRKFHQADDNFLRDAERLLTSEISLVMELPAEEARNYLREHLQRA